MQSLNDILHVARENNYSDVHLGGQNNIMIRNNGILYPYEHSYSVDDVVAMILSMLSISQKEKLEQGKDIDLVYVENMNPSSISNDSIIKSQLYRVWLLEKKIRRKAISRRSQLVWLLRKKSLRIRVVKY